MINCGEMFKRIEKSFRLIRHSDDAAVAQGVRLGTEGLLV